jgi:hypothetical protein
MVILGSRYPNSQEESRRCHAKTSDKTLTNFAGCGSAFIELGDERTESWNGRDCGEGT